MEVHTKHVNLTWRYGGAAGGNWQLGGHWEATTTTVVGGQDSEQTVGNWEAIGRQVGPSTTGRLGGMWDQAMGGNQEATRRETPKKK